jgi:riboflavin kinase/FMN adenylyltransferase
MEIVDAHGGTAAAGAAVTSVGVFDGVHLGHQEVLRALRRAADREGVPATVVLFDRHPATAAGPEPAPRLLTDLRQRFELLEACGVDVAYVLRSDEDRSLPPPDELVREVLVEGLGTRVHVGGEDVHLGDGRGGDPSLLAPLAEGHGIRVETVPSVSVEGLDRPVSSSAVREVVEAGDVEAATRLLGRPHEVRGLVEHGDARGRTIGFPTANVAVAGDILLPADGVYAGWYVGPDGSRRPAAVNVGRRPTFYDQHGLLLVEAHLIDFDGDLYGQRAAVRFVHRLRDEQRFAGIDALAEQLQRDIADAREVLGGTPGG